MSTLTDDVEATYSSAFMIGITNPQLSGATTVDSTRLGKAGAAAESYFKKYTGTAFDETNTDHLVEARWGVIVFAKIYSGQATDDQLDAWVKELKSYAQTDGGRDRVVMKSSSVLTPTSEQVDNETVRPEVDRPDMDGIRVDGP